MSSWRARETARRSHWEIWDDGEAGDELTPEPASLSLPPTTAAGAGTEPQVANLRVTLAMLGEEAVGAGGGKDCTQQQNWVPDGASKTCLLCGKGFNLTRRRHHCRACGNLLCAQCTLMKIVIEDSGSDEVHRVCNPCFSELHGLAAGGGPSAGPGAGLGHGGAGAAGGGGGGNTGGDDVGARQRQQDLPAVLQGPGGLCSGPAAAPNRAQAAAAGPGLSGTSSLIAKNAAAAAVDSTEDLARNSLVGHGGHTPPPKHDGPPDFPTLGVSLNYLLEFTADKVAGKRSRYGTTKVASPADECGDGFLVFKQGEIVAVGDTAQFDDDATNGDWYTGYRRAGDWGERKRFRREHVEWLSGLSTDEVCGQIIKPETSAAAWPAEQRERSYAQMVLAREAGGSVDGIGKATVFASHAWTFVFEELVESLRFFEKQQKAAGAKPSLFWLDIFVVDENAAHTYPSEWWQVSFTQAVGTIGHTALVLTPWRSPVPLRRAWCLWEIYSTLSAQAKLSVCMSDAQNNDFHRGLIEDFETVLESLCLIDAETAEAGSQKDLDMIFAAVRTLDGGFHTLNATVLAQMREMIIESMTSALAATGLRFDALPVEYRTCCAASEDDRDEWDEGCRHLFEDGCGCHDDYGQEDNRLKFGNWWRYGPVTDFDGDISECHICDEHYQELSKMQRRKMKFTPIKSAADLGSDAEKYKVVEYALVGEVVGVSRNDDGSSLSAEARETAATAASLLIQSTRLLGELSADTSENCPWNFEEGARKALELRKQLYGERDLRTAEAIVELSKVGIEGALSPPC